MIKHLFSLAFVALMLLNSTQQTLAQTPNTVEWETPYAYWGAGDFAIRIGDKYFTAQVPVTVRSDPGNDQYTTLETDWTEHGVPMRLYAYFRMNPPEYPGRPQNGNSMNYVPTMAHNTATGFTSSRLTPWAIPSPVFLVNPTISTNEGLPQPTGAMPKSLPDCLQSMHFWKKTSAIPPTMYLKR